MFPNKNDDWRKRVLDRLDSLRPEIVSSIPTEEMEEMYKIAAYYDTENADAVISDESVSQPKITEDISSSFPQSKHLLSASCSFLQKCTTPDVPYHIQIVVPGVTGTASADDQQTFEISVWERTLLEIFCGIDADLLFFEFCSMSTPLIIDVFMVPENVEPSPYWKSAFESESNDEMNNQLQKLHTRSMKGVYPRNIPYLAVTFNNGGGFGKKWDGGEEPRKMAIDVVAYMWSISKQEPPQDVEEQILSYNGWPH